MVFDGGAILDAPAGPCKAVSALGKRWGAETFPLVKASSGSGREKCKSKRKSMSMSRSKNMRKCGMAERSLLKSPHKKTIYYPIIAPWMF
jgi:hypothetical protein